MERTRRLSFLQAVAALNIQADVDMDYGNEEVENEVISNFNITEEYVDEINEALECEDDDEGDIEVL
jgi:hypothetical protein